MAVPWQPDTASSHAGYPGTEFPTDSYIPTFWPSRVPNAILTEQDYRTVTDTALPMDTRLAAFYNRPNWLRSLDFSKPYVEQITKMVHTFGDLGLIEKRSGAPDGQFPGVLFVETLPATAAPALMSARALPPSKETPVTNELAQARFGG